MSKIEARRDFLHKTRTHHTNISIPGSKYINGLDYPEQYLDFLGKVFNFKFRNQYKADAHDLDDVSKADEKEYYFEHNIFNSDCFIIRADKAEPYKVVAISTDFKFILVYDNHNGGITFNDDITIDCETITQYPIQLNEFIGISLFDYYKGPIDQILGVTLRVDNGEPCYTVIAEFVENGQIRIVLGDECFSRLFDYYPFLDLNAKDPEFNPTDPSTYKDIDGYYPAFYQNYNGAYRDEYVNDARVHKELVRRYMENYVSVVEGFDGDITIEYNDQGEPEVFIEDTKYKWDDPHTLQVFLKLYPDDTEIRNRILALEIELERLLSEEYAGPRIDNLAEIIEGGRADILRNIYNKKLKGNEIAEMRKKIFKENKLYGIDEYIIAE